MASFLIAGTGSYLPPRVVKNREIASLVGLDAHRIAELFQIEERRWVRSSDSQRPMPGQSLADLAARAVQSALDDAGLRVTDIDLLVAVSTTPEYISPPLDYRIRWKLNTRDLVGFTIHSACTGVFRAATIVEALLANERAHVAVVVAADALSQYFAFDPSLPKDLRMSMALYGDGAAAIVAVRGGDILPAVDALGFVTTATTECPGIVFSTDFADPEAESIDSSFARPAYHDFRRVLEKGSALTFEAGFAVLKRIGKSIEDIDHVLTHQATGNMKKIGATIGLPAEKVHVNIAEVGNTLSASTLILFDQLKRRDTFKPGELILMCSAESATWSHGGMAIHWR